MSQPIPPPNVSFLGNAPSPIATHWYDFLRGLAGLQGTWTPTLTFATPGNLSVAYSLRSGIYTKIGRLVFAEITLTTSTFTHTTASGICFITGLPYPAAELRQFSRGAVGWSGITKANYTDVNFSIDSFNGINSKIALVISGSGQPVANVTAADMPTGGTVNLTGSLIYPTPQ